MDDQSTLRNYIKVMAMFQCSNDKCKRHWFSFHAWKGGEIRFCEHCGKKAEIDDVKDEMHELSNFNCPGCENHWQTLCTDEDEECDCGEMVFPNGTQIRFARHFWLACPNEKCKQKWEDYSLKPQRTQRCSTCKNQGIITGTEKIKPNKSKWKKKNFGDGGTHDAEHCDMCNDLKKQGISTTCLKYYRVKCRAGAYIGAFDNEKNY